MGRHQDDKIARKYGLPVQVLREGLPKVLHLAPDHEVRDGNVVRVSSAAGLQAVRAQVAAEGEPIQVYLVPYMPPVEADRIRRMLGIDLQEEQEEEDEVKYIRAKLGLDEEETIQGGVAGGGPGPAAAHLRPVVIANPHVMWAKKLALMAIKGERINIARIMEQMKADPGLSPQEVTRFPVTDHDLGLNATKNNLMRLKESYLAARASSGHTQVAIEILKQINKTYYRSLFKPQGGSPLTKEEERVMITEIANDYKDKYQLKQESLSARNIAKQLLGVISLADLEDRKKIIINDSAMTGEKKTILKRLKKEKRKFGKLQTKESLIGAALPDFRELI